MYIFDETPKGALLYEIQVHIIITICGVLIDLVYAITANMLRVMHYVNKFCLG